MIAGKAQVSVSDDENCQQRHHNHKPAGETGEKPNLVPGVEVHEILRQEGGDPLLQRGPMGNWM